MSEDLVVETNGPYLRVVLPDFEPDWAEVWSAVDFELEEGIERAEVIAPCYPDDHSVAVVREVVGHLERCHVETVVEWQGAPLAGAGAQASSGPSGSWAGPNRPRDQRPVSVPALGTNMELSAPKDGAREDKEYDMDRSNWDKIVSGAGAVIAVVLIALGAMAIYGGNFGQQNVRDRLVPQNISFPPAEAMTPQEKADIGTFAGQKVETGVQAEAFSRYIGGHLEGINDGATYSETSAAAREEGLDADKAAELQEKADTLFKGESLRAMLLNAYGWWTVATIALWAGVAMVIAGLLMGIFSILGFRHARKVAVRTAEFSAVGTKSLVGSTV